MFVRRIILIGILLILLIVLFSSIRENFETQDVIGKESKTVHLAFIRPKVPNMVFPLRRHVNMWIAKVPLVPFKAPLVILPPIEEIPPFLLYKPEILAPVRNQGDCGSCWAFAVCNMLSDRLTISTGGIFDKNLSVQQLMACFNRDGCNGGSPEDACMWMADKGKKLNTAKQFPYKNFKGGMVDTPCKYKKGLQVGIMPDSVKSIVEYIDEKDNYTPDEKMIINSNVANMKRELVGGGPFYCAMSVYDDLYEYTGLEVYKRNKHASLIGGHAIEIIGYCEKGVDTRRGFQDAYWICRNSWGDNWPTNTEAHGYFVVQMGVNMCGIESRCGFAEPVLSGKYKRSIKPKTLEELRYTNIEDYL